MEHCNCKSHVVDVTTAGMYVIQHEEHLLGQRQAKYLFIGFISSTFTVRVIVGSTMGKPACCPTLQELL